MTKPLIIITGASSGIGAGLAQAFSKAGYPLGLLARNLTAMEALNLPNTRCVETDVTDIDQVKAAIQKAEEHFGPTECLINNAGFGKGGDFTEVSHQDHQTMIEVNILCGH